MTSATAPADSVSVTAVNPALSKRDKALAEDFDAALSQEDSRLAPKSETAPQNAQGAQQDAPQAATASDSSERFVRSRERFSHVLRGIPPQSIAETENGDSGAQPLEAGSRAATGTDGQAGSSDEVAIIAARLLGALSDADDTTVSPAVGHDDRLSHGGVGDVHPNGPEDGATETAAAALATQLIGSTSAASAGGIRSKGDTRTGARAGVAFETGQSETQLRSTGGDGSDVIADTAVTVREQQTHFSRGSAGRSGPLPHPAGVAADGATNSVKHEPGPARNEIFPPAAGAKGSDGGLAAAALKAGNAGLDATEPVNEPAPASQIANKIIDARDENSPPGETRAASSTWMATDRPFGSMLRLIRLELSPGSLGVVHITLKGANSNLSVSIEAERSQTAASIGADQSALSSRLREAGYVIDDLVVTSLDRSADGSAQVRSEPPSTSANGGLANGSDESQRRHADESGRRTRPDIDPMAQGGTVGAADDPPQISAEPQRASATAWRGRHLTRSV